MKKTFTINLGNRVFSIDEDAYERLQEYLERIEGYFSDQKEREDIINDIEIRISELFSERLSAGKQVITILDVEEIITVMGDPGVIAGDKEDKSRSYSHHERGSSQRRLFRDPENRIIGGVCGGLGAYLNIDPLIIRILVAILSLTFGVGLLIYLILWIVVPEARTTAQKLEMRGDSVNASNIGKFVRDEFESVKKSFRGNKRK